MPVPFILGGLAVAAAGYGVKKGIDAKDKIDRTENIQIQIKDLINRCNILMKSSKENATNSIQKLGQTKISVMSISMKEFVDIYSKMKNVNFTDIGIDELKNFKPENKEIAELQVASVGAVDLTVSSAGAIAGSTLLAAGTYGAVMHGGFALASTGTAIGTLHGVAATNATLAWLGGGSLATGGFGMAGGMAVLGGIVVGPALALGGALLDSKAEDKLYEALQQKDNAIKFQKEVEQSIILLNGIADRSNQFTELIGKVNTIFITQITKLKTIVEFFGLDYVAYPEKAKHIVAMNAMLAKTLKIILDIPLLNKNGLLEEKTEVAINVFGHISASEYEDTSLLANYVKEYTTQTACMLNEELLSVIVSAIKIYQTELNEYILTLAENGDSKSIFELGRDLENYSLELAEKCYKIAGNLGYILAFYKLDSLHD